MRHTSEATFLSKQETDTKLRPGRHKWMFEFDEKMHIKSISKSSKEFCYLSLCGTHSPSQVRPGRDGERSL